MEWLPTSILPREARFAYVASAFRLAEIYVPFVSSTEVSENRILGSNAYSHCQPVAVENREAIRTTSMMDDCNSPNPDEKKFNSRLVVPMIFMPPAWIDLD
jgi:hypothetical protein